MGWLSKIKKKAKKAASKAKKAATKQINKAGKRIKKEAKKAAKTAVKMGKQAVKQAMPLAGAALGGMVGGPMGASIGSQLGNAASGKGFNPSDIAKQAGFPNPPTDILGYGTGGMYGQFAGQFNMPPSFQAMMPQMSQMMQPFSMPPQMSMSPYSPQLPSMSGWSGVPMGYPQMRF